MEREPWVSFKDACYRLNISRRTIDRLVDAGILIRVYDSIRAKGLTIDSVANYEVGIAYKNQRDRGLTETLSWSSKDQSPLHHALVTGHYRSRSCSASSDSGPQAGGSHQDRVAHVRNMRADGGLRQSRATISHRVA